MSEHRNHFRAHALKRAADAVDEYVELEESRPEVQAFRWAARQIRKLRLSEFPNVDSALCRGAQTDYCKTEATRCLECPMKGKKNVR